MTFEDMEVSDTCAICLSSMDSVETLTIENCRHSFCYSCLMQWSQLKLACPMCQSSYEKAECSSSKRVVKFEKPEKPPQIEETFDCFDVSYFEVETEKLLRFLEQSKLIIDSHSFLVDKITQEKDYRKWSYIDHIEGVLKTLRDTLKADVKFNPQGLLKDIHVMHDNIKALRKGNTPLITLEDAKPKRYSADDYSDDDDDDDDYYEDERYDIYY